MPNIKYTYNHPLPHSATYRKGDESFDLVAGNGDTVEIPEAIAQTSSIQNLVQTGILAEVKTEKASKPAKQTETN